MIGTLMACVNIFRTLSRWKSRAVGEQPKKKIIMAARVVLYYIVYGHTCETPLYNNIRYIHVVMCVNAM